jgi:prevent-host-death family protein
MKNTTNNTIVGLKELRENIDRYIAKVEKGDSFVVVRKSKPVFKIAPVHADDGGMWETIIDFTKIKKGGVPIEDILSRL